MMTIGKIGSTLILTVVSMQPTFAASEQSAPDFSKAFTGCMDSASNTVGMVECIMTEHDLQDKRLNTAYKSLLQSLPPERQRALRAAQRAWIIFRDDNCAFYYDPDGGTLARVEGNMCVLRMTAERSTEIEGLKGGE